ncbi:MULTISPECIES: phosphodiesterase [unclassified Leifsonia]|uniref:phosphodiesterase n=1 Tax=unclassified Leifsonia TaxID=2663824 RepID=UPI0006F5E473|nr:MULTISPECIES: phosphodiesterase [unclassified Leifsonia]KQX07188.1 3',5'-cyclic-nucleotide phosphodiesterase [Leifsonia sp. Root1293]KRA11471.1 3',5'-cyclic-nucleotide phosphodiesterase [Leifsonia sp. Root60]
MVDAALPPQFGQYPAPGHVIAHLSDTHFLAGGPLYGTVDTDTGLAAALQRLEASGIRLDAFVFTGDITDRGEPDAYARVRSVVEPVAARIGAEVIWVMGNHDERMPFRRGLLAGSAGVTGEETAPGAPVDTVTTVRGLRVIALDTSVPGYHHGAIDDAQLAWLADVLSEPAEHGSLLALHHPPIPTAIGAMQILELERQERLAAVIEGSDIRAILGGHLHYTSTSLFAGIPVSVAAATCYTMDLAAPVDELIGTDAGQSLNLVHVYDDRVVHSVVPLTTARTVTRFGSDFTARMLELDAEGRRDAFSRQRPVDG